MSSFLCAEDVKSAIATCIIVCYDKRKRGAHYEKKSIMPAFGVDYIGCMRAARLRCR